MWQVLQPVAGAQKKIQTPRVLLERQALLWRSVPHKRVVGATIKNATATRGRGHNKKNDKTIKKGKKLKN